MMFSFLHLFGSFSLGFDTDGLSSAVWPGGETEALTRLERHLERKVQCRFQINLSEIISALFR